MAERQLNVHFLPNHVAAKDLAGSAVIVVDLLRASTTICQALASGAREVVPFLEVSEALAAAAEMERSQYVLGGERKGGRIPGFDLGNSPAEYTPAAVAGRRVLITTTNGTRALQHARNARRVLVGAIVNLSAVAASILDEPRVDILCAGTDGDVTLDDILASGAIVQQVGERSNHAWRTNDDANEARRVWEQVLAAAKPRGRTPSAQLAIALRDTTGGRNLIGIGLDTDLLISAQIDRLSVVPELDLRTGIIHRL